LTNIKNISDEILEGFDKKEIKAVYYSLTIDPNNSVTDKTNACIDCAN
jgi:hypothetical protein